MSTVAERKKYDIAAMQRVQGLQCPQCRCRDLRVKWTEPMGNRIKRHRYCRNCGYGPIVSFEEIPSPPKPALPPPLPGFDEDDPGGVNGFF